MVTQHIDARGRQNVGRVDHLVFAYKSKESRDAARRHFEEVLRITDWMHLGVMEEGGVDVLISFSSGFELLYPVRAGSTLDAHLEARGEGLYTLVYGVTDAEEAAEHAASKGAAIYRIVSRPEEVDRRFEVFNEIRIGEVGGIDIILGEFKPHPAP